MMQSALYSGSVMHRRYKDRAHHFRYRVFWTLLDLDDLSGLGKKLWFFSHNRFNIFSLYDRDHGDGSDRPLREQAERLLAEHNLEKPAKFLLFAMPRTFGYSFNPLSVYFCYDAAGALTAMIYQVHNTFGGRHAYVRKVELGSDLVRHYCAKDFYVSPFLPMDLAYRFRVVPPEERIAVSITVEEGGKRVFDAALAGRRKLLSDFSLLQMAFAIPFVTLKVIVAIYIEALRLRRKGLVPVFPDELPESHLHQAVQ